MVGFGLRLNDSGGERRGGRPGLPVPNSLCGRKATLICSISELRSCVKVEVDVLGSLSLICGRKATLNERPE